MEKTNNSNEPSIIFGSMTEHESLSKDPSEANVPLTNKINFAISDEAADRELNARVQDVVQTSQSSLGLLFACAQISMDWNKLSESGLYLGDWYIHLNRLIKKLQHGSDFETDRQQAKSIKNPVLKLLSRIPSQNFDSNQKDWVLAIRGLVIFQSLVINKKPSHQLIRSVTKLLAKNIAYEKIADLNLTAIKDYVIGNNRQENELLIDSLQSLLVKPWMSLNSVIRPKNLLYIQTGASFKNSEPSPITLVQSESITEKERDQSNKKDLINYITYMQQFLGEKQNVGIIERYEYVQKFEIELVIPKIIADLKDPNFSKLALATLLTFLLHCRPERFKFIGLNPTSEATAWLDVNKGAFYWTLNAVIEKNKKDSKNKTNICIPLPAEVVAYLRQFYHQHHGIPTSLDDLFDYDPKRLDAECKQYLRNKSLSSHRQTLSRLESSYSRYLLSHTNDEVYAAAIGLDFCIGTTSNFNYCLIQGNKLTQVLQSVYRKIGFSEQLLVSPNNVRPGIGLNYEIVWELLESLSVEAHQIISTAPKNLMYQNIVETHNKLALTIGSMVVIFTGHRAAEAYTFSAHTIDLERKLCLICDKRVNDYQTVRLVSIPSLICQWLALYFSWLESLQYRLSAINKQLAFQVEAAINSTSAQSHPLFFTIYNKQVEAFSSKDFSNITKNLNLPTNCGRHFIDYLLRDAELDSAHIMAFEGHANKGREAFGPTSLMSLIQVAENIRYAIDQAIDIKKLILPPKFKPRRYVSNQIRFPRIQFTNLLKDKYEIKDKRSAQCPFDERCFELLNALSNNNQEWVKTSGKITLNDLVYSLTVIDGVASLDELMEVVSQLLDAEIYVLDDKCFVDTVTKKLGVRRVWISLPTLLIAAALGEEGDKDQLKPNLNNDAFKLLCKTLVNSVAAHYSVYATGMLAAWARGEVCSRTTRPETLARHHFNYPEKNYFGLTESMRKRVLLDDSQIRKAINRFCDSNQNLGTNETRLKHLLAEIDQLLDFQIEEMSTLVLAKFTQYLISLKIAVSTIKRYYTVVRQFLDYFMDEVSGYSQLIEIDWSEIVKTWVNAEKIDAESGPETAAINHFLTFVESDIKIKGSLYDLNSAVTEHADFPSQNEISKAFYYIANNPQLDEATKLKSKVMIGLLAQYALRPSEVRSIRLCDVYTGDPAHFVITSEAIGKVKTKNANRVLLLKDDQFSTKKNLIELCHLKTGFPANAFVFGDGLDGGTLEGSQLLFNIVHDALSKVTGYNVSIMSFRHLNVSRDVSLSIDNAGFDALKDRKVLSIIAASSGHGHARTSLQNYCCDLDLQRYKFWDQHRTRLKLSVPLLQVKKRMGLTFKGNLPLNHSSFLILMQILKDQLPKTHARIKNCQHFVIKDDRKLPLLAETNYKHFAASYKYCFYKFADSDCEVAVFHSNILEREKRKIDEGCRYLKDTLNKDWRNSQIGRFSSIIQSPQFSIIVSQIAVIPIDDRNAIQIAQAITDLSGKWEIKNLKLLDLLERNLSVFHASSIDIEMSVNQNIEVNTRKSLRKKPFKYFSEKILPSDVFCQISFWDLSLKNSLRARHHQEIMLKLNLIFLTKALLVLGERYV